MNEPSPALLPADHPLRRELNDEVHARPPEVLAAPASLTYLVLASDWSNADRERAAVAALAERYGASPPAPGANHHSVALGELRLRWERHTEFARYTFITRVDPTAPFAAQAPVPREWIAALPGETMVAAQVALVSGNGQEGDYEAIAARHFEGNPLLGSAIAGGAALALTDFRIHADGFSRVLVADRAMTPRQAGRMVQRLLEIDTYRVMALLAFPTARRLAPQLTAMEHELGDIVNLLAQARDTDEPLLLDRLTRLSAQVEGIVADSHYRFSAASAYRDLVERRIAELREERIQGLQTFYEFTERRLAPAMNTCRAVAERQRALAERVARATQLLSTRVDLTRQRQNQALLASMDRRAQLQLRLQQTVEGLSIAAITYYLVGLVAYASKAAVAAGWRMPVDLVVGASIPLIAIGCALALRVVRRKIERARG